MAVASRFFPYDPRALRYGLFASAAASALLAALALASARAHGGASSYARAGLLLLLLVGFGGLSMRVRPRPGWGVTVDALGVRVARPLAGEDLYLVWSQLAEVRREGPRRDRLALVGGGDASGRLVVSRRLFGSAAEFEALAEALEARMPARRVDA